MVRLQEWCRNHWKGTAVILLAAAVASGPILLHGAPCGNDFSFHFTSWLDAQRSFALGLPNPHWAGSPNLGAGEPRFVFYPPLMWVAGGVLGMVLPWTLVPVVVLFLLFVGTGLANRALAREWMDDAPATLAGCASIFLGYALFSAYKRSAYAEMTGGFWIPLLLIFLLRRRQPSGSWLRGAFDGSVVPLALVVAGACLSNGPVLIMARYLMAGVVLLAAWMERSWAPIVRAVAATVLGLGLSAIYLLPAVWEHGAMNLQHVLTAPHYLVENGFLFARSADRNLYGHDQLLRRISWLAVAMLAVCAAGALISWKRGTLPPDRRWRTLLLLIPPVVLFLMLPASDVLWRSLPALRILQFPWRWLLVLEVPLAVFLASALWVSGKVARCLVAAGCGLAFVAIVAGAAQAWFKDCTMAENDLLQAFYAGSGTKGMWEYAPPGALHPAVEVESPAACLLLSEPPPPNDGGSSGAPAWNGDFHACGGKVAAGPFAPEQKTWRGVADHPGYLVVRLRSFPAWSVTVNGRPVQYVPDRIYDLIAIPVQPGPIDVHIDWTTTRDVFAGRCISFAFLVLLLLAARIERRQAAGQLS